MKNNNIDTNLNNADWLKKSWDLPTTLDELSAQFNTDDKLRVYVRNLMNNPVGRSMPDSLKKELRAKFGNSFVPKYLDTKPPKKTKVEKKDVSAESVSNTVERNLNSIGTLKKVQSPKKRNIRTRRLIKFRKPEAQK